MGDGIFARLAAIPILALFIGIAILAGRVAMDWNPQNTDTLIGGLIAVCGAGLGLFGVVFGALLGLAIYKRLQNPLEHSGRQGSRSPRMIDSPYYAPLPPGRIDRQLEDKGTWSSRGPESYDIYFPDEEAEEREWRDE
jgi:hypothetical protein